MATTPRPPLLRRVRRYERLVNGLAFSGTLPANAEMMANPVLPPEILTQAVPGNLRRADTFVRYLQKLVQHLKERMRVEEVVQMSPTAFLHKLDDEEEDFSKPMRFVSDRLRSLLRTLEVRARGPKPNACRPPNACRSSVDTGHPASGRALDALSLAPRRGR